MYKVVSSLHEIEISHLGPIQKCSLNENEFIILTGPQASGKSTIAKAIFFFRTIKDDLLDLALRRFSTSGVSTHFNSDVEKLLRSKFLQIFGSSWAMDKNMTIHYTYSENTAFHVSLTDSLVVGEPNYIWFEYSNDLRQLFRDWENMARTDSLLEMRNALKSQLEELFCDPCETVFIPAGRSMITLLTTQLNYIFTTMDESQKRNIDYCTQTYIERILKLKPSFSNGIHGLLSDKLHLTQDVINKPIINEAIKLIDLVLKGKYTYVDGEERLMLNNSKYVKINFTSSGQQESVWIFNLIFYYLLENKPIFLILEEPESHLYPDAQKAMAELVGLLLNAQNGALITTHSPYILGELNNLFLAGQISGGENREKVNALIPPQKQLHIQNASAYYVSDGVLSDCIESDLGLIRNEVIDGASLAINDENDSLFELLQQEAGGKWDD